MKFEPISAKDRSINILSLPKPRYQLIKRYLYDKIHPAAAFDSPLGYEALWQLDGQFGVIPNLMLPIIIRRVLRREIEEKGIQCPRCGLFINH